MRLSVPEANLHPAMWQLAKRSQLLAGLRGFSGLIEMPESDQEVFEHFRTDYPDGTREVGLLAYARYAQDKYDWINQRLSRANPLHTEREITKWISDLPNTRLAEIHAGALNLFREAAETYMEARIQEERTKAVNDSILGRVNTMAERVERATSFRATWLPNVFVGIIASLGFTLLVMIGAAIYHKDPSPFALFKEEPSSAKPAAN